MSLRNEMVSFERWMQAYPAIRWNNWWELEYPNWWILQETAGALLDATPLQQWLPREINDFLFVLARDNEFEGLANRVAEDTDRLLFLTR